MSENIGARVVIFLECINCNLFRYTTKKNRYNTSMPLALKKFCPFCLKHTIHKERKK
uniref:Large ribosomal subunit protein bL33c n=40 Tax=Ephedra TaxID=3387 RepID=A0A8F4TI19_9SPER|nr:ribosomal protein L33 [Ephedra equisetina]YP_009694733.1 ribosomal protein L33 [Ephedra intermedia]YP_009694806.1 ribosomal protein L33 [Ephedra sinica]YP_010048940.1 ribosomal protein L33 [Ephedra monosperma]YP_010207353.1 ribosomal protein L33 [Ephedra przewalskii]YP_010451861.1 ribosomal protein L33 [Ephedra alata]YP_010451928.1 ribosomal protein L33 [Ephedra altissima]YP_010451995.1 ribosomal protein L33 [Ephedra americana]YP_010452062.1 ribosomal protein L33 [Ephedra andina]YP_0104